MGCYEHIPEELRYRLFLQVEAVTGSPHKKAPQEIVERVLTRAGEAVLLYLNSREDTVRALEDSLLHEYALPVNGAALVAVDYLNRVPDDH